MKIFGKTVSTPMAVAVAGGSGLAIWFAWKQHKASSASSPSAIDPITGLPFSQDSQTDPLTGMSYLAEAQQYGSVQAAENAVAGESSIDYSSAYGTGSGIAGTSGGQNLVPASTVQGTTYASNAAWAQAAEAGLTDIGYSSTDVAAALGRYLAGLSLTAAQATIVQAAIAEYGPPPVGSFQVIMAPPDGSGPTNPTGGGAGVILPPVPESPPPDTGGTSSTGPFQPVKYPAPTGLSSYSVSRTGYRIKWNAVKGPHGETPTGYTVATYQTNGVKVDEFTVAGTDTAEYGAGGKGLHPGYTYHTNVWANGGQQSPPHATVTVTLKK